MRDLSLHILDLAQNSVRANAALVEIMVSVDESRLITITIRDDGSGMSDELKERVTSPFATTRTTRKVGLGIPLMMQNARLAGGDVRIDSTLGQGTTLTATLHGTALTVCPWASWRARWYRCKRQSRTARFSPFLLLPQGKHGF